MAYLSQIFVLDSLRLTSTLCFSSSLCLGINWLRYSFFFFVSDICSINYDVWVRWSVMSFNLSCFNISNKLVQSISWYSRQITREDKLLKLFSVKIDNCRSLVSSIYPIIEVFILLIIFVGNSANKFSLFGTVGFEERVSSVEGSWVVSVDNDQQRNLLFQSFSKFFSGIGLNDIDDDRFSVLIKPVSDSFDILLSSVGSEFFLVDLNFEVWITQNLIDWEAKIDMLQELERAALVNTIYCNGRFRQILDWVDCSKLTLWNFAHEVDHAISISRSIVLKLLSVNVESKSGIATNSSSLSNFSLFWKINSSDYELWVFSFKFGSKFFIFWGKFDTMSASCRVVLNEDEFVVLDSGLIGLIGQLDNVSVLDFSLLVGLCFVVEFFDFALADINQELSQWLF